MFTRSNVISAIMAGIIIVSIVYHLSVVGDYERRLQKAEANVSTLRYSLDLSLRGLPAEKVQNILRITGLDYGILAAK